MDKEKIQELVSHCVSTLRSRGMRRTRALELVIEELAKSPQPLTIAKLASKARLKKQCDQATVYRLVMKLLEQGLVRRLGLHERSTFFALIVPHVHHDYLVCTECGSIQDIDMSCPVAQIEKELMKKSGFTQVYHELEFFGTCPACAS